MFISIPKEFFVPVIYGENFVFNEESNNLELDTDLYRESTKTKATENIPIKESGVSEAKKETIISNKKAESTIEEKTNVAVKNKATKKECIEINTMYIELKSKEVADKCKISKDIFSELDDEYINNVDKKDCKNK